MEREGFQMNTIAERIKFAMKAKNKKQVDIVKDTGISKGAFSSYLSGQYNPKTDRRLLRCRFALALRTKCAYGTYKSKR